MEIFDGTIRHQQSVLMFKIRQLSWGEIDGLLRAGPVLRMNSREDKFHGRFRRGVVLKDAKGFLGPQVFAG